MKNPHNIEMVEMSDQTNKPIFMGTVFTLILLLISLSYGLAWAILFLVYTSQYEYDPSCSTLISWDRALYITQFISSGLHIISSVIQLISSSYDIESSIPKYITGCRSCIVYVAGITNLVGINVTYFKHGTIEICADLQKLNLAYIITEWTIMGSFICFVCSICIISLALKKIKAR